MPNEEPAFKHLGLKSWPFCVVPDDETIKTWAGRPEFKRQSYAILRSATRIPTSQVTLIWAWYGSGKSHTLRHLAWRCSTHADTTNITPIYTVFPGQVRDAMALYKAIVTGLDLRSILAARPQTIEAAARASVPETWRSNFINAIKFMQRGDETARGTIRGWLGGDKMLLSTLRNYSIDRRIESMEDCIEALSALIALVRTIDDTKAVLLMIDEFQDVSKLPPRKLNELNSFLHKLFDANPRGLQLFLSFTTGDKETIIHLLGEALQNRVSNTLSLPEFDQEEAAAFLNDLILLHAISENAPKVFTPEALKAIPTCLQGDQRRLIPRELIIEADKVLRAADPLIEEESMEVVDEAYVNAILRP